MEWYWFCVLTDPDFILWDTDFILCGDTVTDWFPRDYVKDDLQLEFRDNLQ